MSKSKQVVGEQQPVATPPTWIRLPARGHCRYCGLSRGHLYRLMAEGEIKYRKLPGNGKTRRGVTVVNLPSVLEYIESQAAEPIAV